MRQRAERLQRALFQIAQLATADLSEDAFYRSIHQVVGELLNAQNFYIALLSEDGSAIEFPYYVDDSRRELPTRRPLGSGLSEYVLRNAQALLCSTEDILALAERGEIELAVAGPPAVCWLGVPLFIAGKAVGLVTVQSYDADTHLRRAGTGAAGLRRLADRQQPQPPPRRADRSSMRSRCSRSAWPSARTSCATRSPSACACRNSCATKSCTTR